MGKYRVLGSLLDRVFRINLNANFDDVDADIQAQKKRVDDLILANPQPKEIEDSRGGFAVLRDRLDHTDALMAEKATKGEITGLDFKTSSDADKIKLINLSDEVKQAMAGTTPINASVANGSLTKEKYANGSILDFKTDFITTGKNLYDASKLKTGIWANWSTGVIGALAGWNCSDYIPVLPSTQYATRFNASRAYYTSDYVFISGGDQTKVFTTPANCAYVIINFQDANVSGQQLEQGSVFTTYEPFYNKFKNEKKFEIEDDTIEPKKLVGGTMSEYLGDDLKGTLVADYYVKATTGELTAYGSSGIGGVTDFIPVSSGDVIEYFAYANSNAIGAIYNSSNVYLGALDYPTTANTSKRMTMTTNGFIRVNYSTSSLTSFYVKKVLNKYSFEWFKPEGTFDNLTPTQIKTLANYTRFYGGKANFIGDSVTRKGGVSDDSKRYSEIVKNKLGLSLIRNYGENGTRIAPQSGTPDESGAFVNRYHLMDNDADLIVVFGATNDYWSGTAPMGEENSTDKTTFYGALNNLITGLQNKYLGKEIIFITPFNQYWVDKNSDTPNPTTGLNLEGYVNAIKKRCAYYGVTVLDLFTSSGMDIAHNETHRTYFSTDGVHINDIGNEVVANLLVGKVKTR